MSTEATVAAHYTRERIEDAILQSFSKAGISPERLTVNNLWMVDELHLGGIEAIRELSRQMDLRPGLELLDIGCGIGGPARFFAAEHGCRVSGVDLTEEFVRAATGLTRRVKLDHLVEFHCTSALDLPFEQNRFDGAYMIHVGMNIEDKAGIFREARRVLKPGGLFAIYDIMRADDGPLRYPLPWALNEQTSFVAKEDAYCDALQNAGFRVVRQQSRLAFGIEFIQSMRARMAQNEAPASPGIAVLIGERMPEMMANVMAAMQQGMLEPVELFAEAA